MSTAGLRLKFTPQPAADKTRPFNFAQDVPTSPTQQGEDELQLPAPPTSWLPAKDQRVFGSEPLRENGGYVKCKDCAKVVMKSTLLDHMGMSELRAMYETWSKLISDSSVWGDRYMQEDQVRRAASTEREEERQDGRLYRRQSSYRR